MSKLPETFQDSDGKWVKEQAFVEEMVQEDPDVSADRWREAVEELIDDGVMRSRELGGTTYLQLTSRRAAAKVFAEYYGGRLKDRFLGGRDDE